MKPLLFQKIYSDLYCGFSFFSRLPVHRFYKENLPFSFSRSLWTWPFVACILGGLEGLFLYLLCLFPLNSWNIAFLGTGFQLLLTGALHEDGLADIADGFGGGKTAAQKLEIMKDSRLGTYGVLTLVIFIGIKVTSLSSLLHHPDHILPILISCAILSRMTMLLPLIILKPARSIGLASELAHIPYWVMVFNPITSLILIFLFLPFSIAILSLGIALMLSLLTSFLACRQIKGYTGDVLGAIQVITSTGFLLTTAAYFH